jgi:hypothetical protein
LLLPGRGFGATRITAGSFGAGHRLSSSLSLSLTLSLSVSLSLTLPLSHFHAQERSNRVHEHKNNASNVRTLTPNGSAFKFLREPGTHSHARTRTHARPGRRPRHPHPARAA